MTSPELKTALEVQPHQSWVQNDDHLPAPANCAIANTNQDAVGLGHLGTLLAHVHLSVDQHSQNFFLLSIFQPHGSNLVVLQRIFITEMQHSALDLAKAHTIGLKPYVEVKPTGVFLKGKSTENVLGFNLSWLELSGHFPWGIVLAIFLNL